MNPTGTEALLRPLGIGEILDRAVNLCVRNFVTLGLIYIVFVVPLSVIQFYATKDFATLLQSMTDVMKAGGNDSAEVYRKIAASQSSGLNPWTLVLWVTAFFIGPLPAGALVAAVAAYYLKQTTSFSIAYRVGLSRWGQMLGLMLMYGFAGGFLYFLIVLVLVALGFAVAVLYAVSSTAAIVVGVILGVVAILLAIVALTLVLLSTQLSVLAIVVEGVNFVTAFISGLRRVFSGIGFRRALPFGFAYLAIFIGIGLVGGIGEVVLTGLLKNAAAGVAYGAVVRVITAAFSTAFMVIFYYDLRVREEGLDLALAAQTASGELVTSP